MRSEAKSEVGGGEVLTLMLICSPFSDLASPGFLSAVSDMVECELGERLRILGVSWGASGGE